MSAKEAKAAMAKKGNECTQITVKLNKKLLGNLDDRAKSLNVSRTSLATIAFENAVHGDELELYERVRRYIKSHGGLSTKDPQVVINLLVPTQLLADMNAKAKSMCQTRSLLIRFALCSLLAGEQIDVLPLSVPVRKAEPKQAQLPELLPGSDDQGVEDYYKPDFLREVYISEALCDRLLRLLTRKKNLIIQGAPGVGKTFAVKRFCWAVMGQKDESRIEFVQFHQNYTYEDFVMGFRPTETGFELRHGCFYEFCKKAAGDPDRDYFFLIDEINRANLSKVFGELLMLIESDHRGEALKLAYSKEMFSVPENVYIIGMMNTSDRSLSVIDYALRRRFAFVDFEPAFDSDGFRSYLAGFKSKVFDALIKAMKVLNQEIATDPALGKGFCIGHSAFCGLDADWSEEDLLTELREIVECEVGQTLREYWFDEPERAQERIAKLLRLLD